jgi:hypothetical protein
MGYPWNAKMTGCAFVKMRSNPDRLNGHIGPRVKRNSDIGGRQRRRIVHAVSSHRDTPPAGLKALDCRSLVGRQNLRCDFIDPDPSGRIYEYLNCSTQSGIIDPK